MCNENVSIRQNQGSSWEEMVRFSFKFCSNTKGWIEFWKFHTITTLATTKYNGKTHDQIFNMLPRGNILSRDLTREIHLIALPHKGK